MGQRGGQREPSVRPPTGWGESAGWRGNWDSEVTLNYGGGCQGGSNSQSHTGGWKVTGKWARAEQASCIVPSLAPPPQAVLQQSKEGCPALVNTEGPTPLQQNNWAETKKYGPNEKTEQTWERELSDEEIANLTDGEFKALVMKMLTELIELGWKMRNKWKIPKMK